MEDDQNRDFLLQSRPVTRVQAIGLVVSVVAFLGFGLGIEALVISKYREEHGALAILVLVLGSLIGLLFVRLAWVAMKRIFAGSGGRPS